MAGKPDGGLREVLGLNQAADDLHRERAADAENGAAEQAELFPGSSVFGMLKMPEGREPPRSGPGRPRGSRNRRTLDLADYATKLGGNPVLRMIEIVATPIDVIAKTLGCKLIEAAEYHRKVMSDLGPYIEQKLPTAVQLQGANAGMLVINLGGPVGQQAVGLDITLINQNSADAARIIEHEENQALSDDAGSAPHDDAPHE